MKALIQRLPTSALVLLERELRRVEEKLFARWLVEIRFEIMARYLDEAECVVERVNAPGGRA